MPLAAQRRIVNLEWILTNYSVKHNTIFRAKGTEKWVHPSDYHESKIGKNTIHTLLSSS